MKIFTYTIKRRTWEDIYNSNMLGFINLIMRPFGWAIVAVEIDGVVTGAFPARLRLKCFDMGKRGTYHEEETNPSVS